MGLKDKFRRSHSFFGSVERDDLGAPDFLTSASSFHTALDFPSSSEISENPSLGERRNSRILDQPPLSRGQFDTLSPNLQLGREYQVSPIHGPDGTLPTLAALPQASDSGHRQGIDDIVALLRELKKTASPEHLAAIRNALALDADEHDAAQVPEVLEESPQPATLAHRKSFFKPGVATRTSANVLRKKQPSPKDGKKAERQVSQTWSHEMFVTSPLEQLAGLQNDLTPLAIQRAVTPLDTDYRPLGAYKLGSLRITNGAASPEPSILSVPTNFVPQSNLERMRDYFEVSEGTPSHCTDERSTVGGHSAPTTPGEAYRAAVPLSSPEKSANKESQTMEFRPGSPSSRKWTRSPVSPMGPRQPPLNKMSSRESWMSARLPPAKTTDYSEMYTVEASSNPFLADAASDGNAGHGEGPDGSNETYQAYYHRVDQRAPTPRLNGNSLAHSERSAVLSETSSYYTDLLQPERDPSLRRQRPAFDSGYHSESSLRSTFDANIQNSAHGKANGSENLPTLPDVGALNVYKAAKGSSMNTIIQAPTDSQASYNVHSHIVTHLATPKQAEPMGDGYWPSSSQQTPQPTPQLTRDLVSPHSNPLALSISSKPLTQSTSTPNTPSKSSCKSAESGTPRPNKLKKKDRRKSFLRTNSSPVVVQSAHSEANISTVPAVPVDLASKYTKRMSLNPEMENLEHTFSSVSASAIQKDSSSETNGTEAFEIRFPSPVPSDEVKRSSSRGRRAGRRSIGPEAPSHGFLRSLSRKGRSGERRTGANLAQDDDDLMGVELADFGTVAASLGSSPYEQAMPIGSRSAPPPRGQIQHPHQISYRPAQGKNLIGMSEEQASRLAMIRSRDRQAKLGDLASVPSLTPVESRIRDVGSDGEYQRPRRLDRREEIPPVPLLPRRTPNKRPKSMYEQTDSYQTPSAAPGNEQDTRPAQPKNDRGETWDGTARLWRQRRKSIGEGLLQNRNREDAQLHAGHSQPESAQIAVSERTRPLPRSAAALPRPKSEVFNSRQSSAVGADATSSLHPLSSARAMSPTRMIRNRAAVFERASGRASPAPMPPPESVELYQRPPSAAEVLHGEANSKLMGGAQMSMLSMSMQLRRSRD